MPLRSALWVVLVLLAAASPCRAAKHALLVGVTELLHCPPGKWLQGPANDVVAMRQLLIDKYGFQPANVEILTGRDATKTNIEKAFVRRLVAPVQKGDLAFFYFSGHGTQVKDVTPADEVDTLDEALVPSDARSVETLLLDDEIAKLLERVPSEDILVLLDACHSGTGTRGEARSKYLSPQDLGIAQGTGTRGDAPQQSGDTVGSDLTGPTVLSAAAAHQVAADYPFLQHQSSSPANSPANPYMGALTFYTMKALREDILSTLSYEELMNAVKASMQQGGFEQTPQLEGFTRKRALQTPGTSEVTVKPTVSSSIPSVAAATVSEVRGEFITLQAIGGTRLVKGSIFEATASKDFVVVDAEPTGATPVASSHTKPARVRISGVEGQNASGKLLQGELRSGARLVEISHFFENGKLRVALQPDAQTATTVADLKQQLTRLDFLELVSSNEVRDADIEITRNAVGGLRLTPYRNQQQLPSIIAAAVPDAALKAATVLENLYLVKQFSSLENPNAAFRADVQVNGKDSDAVAINSQISFTARVSRSAYVYLIDVDPAGKVTVLFPNKFITNNRLEADTLYSMPAPQLYKLRVAGPAGPEIVKMIATEQPLKLDVLANNGEFQPLSGSATEITRKLLEQLKREINKNSTRGIVVEAGEEQPISTQGWATDSVLLQIREQ